MQNDSYEYLNEQIIENQKNIINFKQRNRKNMSRKPKEEELKLDLANLANQSKAREMSVKPESKVPFKKTKIEVNKKVLAVGACVMLARGGLATKETIDIAKYVSMSVKINQVAYREAKEFYHDSIGYYGSYDPETEKISHRHNDSIDVVMSAKNTYEDPSLALFTIYNGLDENCRENDFNTYLNDFNLLYGTDYESVKDFLIKNHFKNVREWEEYSTNSLIEMKEEEKYGDSASRR